MRLTLRTLLAYLDDTLEPEEAKQIGQKVAESPVAQELIERIRKVTRRRSLAPPPALGSESHLDPNTVAEYLDSTLPPDELAEVEEKCLADDGHLAEVAACHQILTLILSEPAVVPTPARQRMYRLVRGRESIPYRRPPTTRIEPSSDIGEPTAGRSSRSRIAWIFAMALSIGLVGTLVISWPTETPVRTALLTPVSAPLPVPQIPRENSLPPAEVEKPPKSEPPVIGPLPPKEKPPVVETPQAAPAKKPIARLPIEPPSVDRSEIGTLADPPDLLISHQRGTELWLPAKPKGAIFTNDELMALPGYRPLVLLETGVQVQLWGNLLEFLPLPALECQVTLHRPATGLMADLTLDRGRIVLTNQRNTGTARVRLRYHGEVWDLLLDDKAELMVDGLFNLEPGTRYLPNEGATSPPLQQLFVGVVKGKATVIIEDRDPIELQAPPGQALIGWDNKGRLKPPLKIAEPLPLWTRDIPSKSPVPELKAVMDSLRDRLTRGTATAEIALTELAQLEDKPFGQFYAAYGLQALDAIGRVIDALDDLTKPAMRAAAIPALRHWVARDQKNSLVLHNLLWKDKGYSREQADVAVQLMFTLTESDTYERRTYEFLFQQLEDPKLAVRELAYWHLAQLDPDGARASMYNPANDQQRDAALRRWKQRLTEGRLPPKPPKPASAPSSKNP